MQSIPHYDTSLRKHREEKRVFSQAIMTPIQMPNWLSTPLKEVWKTLKLNNSIIPVSLL